jgi:hypothetical protein
VKVVARVKACLVEDGIVKLSFSEQVCGGMKSVLVQFGSGERAGQVRLVFDPRGLTDQGYLALRPYKKGGAYVKCQSPTVSGLEGMSTEMSVCEVLSVNGTEYIVKLPARKAAPVPPKAPSKTDGQASGPLNMVQFLKNRGHRAEKTGENNYVVDKMRLTKVEMLKRVNGQRASIGLPTLKLEQVE